MIVVTSDEQDSWLKVVSSCVLSGDIVFAQANVVLGEKSGTNA